MDFSFHVYEYEDFFGRDKVFSDYVHGSEDDVNGSTCTFLPASGGLDL